MEFPKSHDLATVIRYADCIKQLFQTSRRRLGPITLNSLLGFYDSGMVAMALIISCFCCNKLNEASRRKIATARAPTNNHAQPKTQRSEY